MAPAVAVDPVAVGDGLGLGLLAADDEHDGDLLELGVADLGADLLGPGVERRRGGRRPGASARTLRRVVGELVGDRQHADLLGGEPEREGAGEVLDQDAHEPLHAAERGAVDHHRPVRLVVGPGVFQAEPLGQDVVELDGAELPLRGRCSRGR